MIFPWCPDRHCPRRPVSHPYPLRHHRSDIILHRQREPGDLFDSDSLTFDAGAGIRGEIALNLIALYKALGGDWQMRLGENVVPEY